MSKDDIELRVSHASSDRIHGLERSESLPLSDDVQLQLLGKRPLLNRTFGFMSILGFTCSVMVSWEGILVTSVQGLSSGGPAGVIWGFLINWIGTLSVFITIAELASMAPTAGGQYHWVAMMAPNSCRNFLTYLTAWLTTAAWQAMSAASGFLDATILQGMIVLTHPDYVPKSWHTVLISWAVMVFAVSVNSTTSRSLANFEGLVLILHLIGFFCVIIPLVYFGPHDDASAVFTTFLNEGGWSSQTLSFFVGLPVSATALLGADCAVHMSEEIQSAATVVPKALISSIMINGALAWSMIIGMLFCIGDLNAALQAQLTMFYPFLEIFQQAVKSTAGATIMASIVLVMGIASGVGVYASASRMLWSFSRDRGLPYHQHLVKLTKTSLPANAILTTLVMTILLSLIVLGSTVAFNALLTLSVASLYSSYLLVCVLLLWRRLTRSVDPHTTDSSMINPNRLTWGPWRIPEPWGAMNNVFACLYLTFIWFWSFWPPMTPTTPQNANFSVLVFGTVVILSVGWYAFRAKHHFTGPVKEV